MAKSMSVAKQEPNAVESGDGRKWCHVVEVGKQLNLILYSTNCRKVRKVCELEQRGKYVKQSKSVSPHEVIRKQYKKGFLEKNKEEYGI